MYHRTAAAILLALATASVAVAQTPAPAKPAEGTAVVNDSLQVTGTVISSEANRLIVKADNGQQMVFIISDQTAEPRLFQAGDRVTASYVTLAGTGTVLSRAAVVPAVTTTTYTAPVTETKVTATVTKPAPGAVTTTTTTTLAPVAAMPYEADKETSIAALPATASSLPLVALLGLVAAGGAVAIRRLH